MCAYPFRALLLIIFNFNRGAYQIKKENVKISKPLLILHLSVVASLDIYPDLVTMRYIDSCIRTTAELGHTVK